MKISQAFSTLEENKHYTFTFPEKASNPKMLCWSESLAKELGFDDPSKFLNMLSGNEVFKESKPIATRYGGHQFGHWAGQLGDGRAIILGEMEYQNKKI